MRAKIFLLLGFLVLSLCACDSDGTDTGNPGIAHPEMGSDPSPIIALPVPFTGAETFIVHLASAACSKLSSCNSAELPDCIASWAALTDIDDELGLTPGTYPTLLDTHDGIIAEEIAGDSTAADLCLDELRNSSCFTPGTEQAYDSGLSDPYINGSGMVPASCNTVF